MAEECNGLLREADIFGRVGGEEFGAVLIEADSKSALDVAQRLRKDLSALSVHVDKEQIRFTVSIGLTCIEKGDDSLEDTMRRADKALYEAKNRGRNCVIYR
jgi:diguanylate cyclase (GGDEF)-like protein